MSTQVVLRHTLAKLVLLAGAIASTHVLRADEIDFDLPSSIECRDVTTRQFAKAHPRLKQIEAVVRVSARALDATEAEIVQFDYEVHTGSAMRVVDYLPKTTMESAIADDRIEITASAEDLHESGQDAHVAFKPLLLGGSHSSSAKKSEAKHFQQLAPRDLVLASGTIDREHGVFFRIRPSRTLALEGQQEFVLTAAVPREWRADICFITCSAKASRRSLMSTSVASVGQRSTPVGMYIVGDLEAAATAEELRVAQDHYNDLLAVSHRKAGLLKKVSSGASSVFARGAIERERKRMEDAEKSLRAVEHHLELLSASGAINS